MEAIPKNVEPRPHKLELLFALDLRYQGASSIAPRGDKVGAPVGGEDGTLTGPRLRGTVRWSNYETTGEDQVCALQVPGSIQTHDGAEIGFEGHEFARPLSEGSHQWRVGGVLRFKTDDRRCLWLNDTFALSSSTFDYETSQASFLAFVPPHETGTDQGEGQRREELP